MKLKLLLASVSLMLFANCAHSSGFKQSFCTLLKQRSDYERDAMAYKRKIEKGRLNHSRGLDSPNMVITPKPLFPGDHCATLEICTPKAAAKCRKTESDPTKMQSCCYRLIYDV